MKYRHLFLSVFLVFAAVELYAESLSVRNPLSAENMQAIENTQSAVTIRTNVRGAAVHLNGVYQGITPLTVKNLVEGIYELSVSKTGYGEQTYFIRAENGCSFTYYINLEKITGYFDIEGAPEGSTVYSDSEMLFTAPYELEEGWHNIKIRKFGYRDYTTRIFIRRHSFQRISVSMSEAPFEITDFTASKNRLNPAYSGGLGKCVFNFHVTAPGSGNINIADMNGNTVFMQPFDNFTTWQQSAVWTGRDTYGQPVPGGIYTATVSAGGFMRSVSLYIDYSMTYHLSDITPSGTGIGNLPAAFMMPKDTSIISLSFSPVFASADTPFYELPVDLSLSITPLDFMEFSGNLKLHAGAENTPYSAGAAVKVASSFCVSPSGLKMCYGLTLKYGYQNKALYGPYGANTGNGLGAGLVFGLDSRHMYAGISSQYILGNTTGNINLYDQVWNNGLTLSFSPTEIFTVKTWCAVNSAFGIYDKNKITDKGTHWLRAVDTGLGCTVLLKNTSIAINTKAGALIYIDSTCYFSGTIGLSYYF